MKTRARTVQPIFLWIALAVAVYLSFASVRLRRMCGFWDYYNYPHLKYGSQITFAELVRYAAWPERAPNYSWSACINELRQIDGAAQQWALENGKTGEDKPTWDDLKPYFGYANTNHPLPCCPYGGHYILGKMKEGPRSTVRGHKLPR